MNMSADAMVHCTDGVAGKVRLVLINPITKEISHVVVRERSFPHVKRLVPTKLLESATDQEIHLACSRHDLSQMRSLVETEFIEPAHPTHSRGSVPHLLLPYIGTQQAESGRKTIPESELALPRGSAVRAKDGLIGTVRLFAVEPASGEITDLVVRTLQSRWGRAGVTIPVSEIERVEERAVHLKLEKASIMALLAGPGQRRRAPEWVARPEPGALVTPGRDPGRDGEGAHTGEETVLGGSRSRRAGAY